MTKSILFSILLLGGVKLFAQEADTNSITQKLDAFLTSANAANKFNGTAIVSQKGQILLNKGYGFKNVAVNSLNDSNSIFQIGSITKSFTAIIILKLQEEGKLSVQDKLSTFFPDYPKGDKISIHNLLTHTSGIYNYTNDIDEGDTAIVCYPVSKDRVLDVFKNKPLAFKPGKYFQYCNSGYFLLGMIIEKVTGKPYETVVREMIFNPLQMNHSGFDFKNLIDKNKTQGYVLLSRDTVKINYTVDSTVYYSAGGIYSTSTDMYKWAKAIANHELLNENSWKRAFTPYQENYGYGFWINQNINEKNFIRHDGGLLGFTSDFIYFPDDNITVILLNNTGNYGNNLTPVTMWLSVIVFGLPYSNWQTQPTNLKISDTTLRKYVGTYIADNKIKIFITLQDGQLFGASDSKQSVPKSPVFPLSETKFFLKDFNIISEFITDKNGNVVKLVTHEIGKDFELKKIE
jgi:CubicO group peptidase (beta-lactamase class C family)